MLSKSPSFDQIPDKLWELDRKLDQLTALVTTLVTASPPVTSITDLSDLLTIKQASELLNLAVPTIYTLVGRKKIPVMKRSRKLYFSRKELENWIREGRKKTINECINEVHSDLKNRAP